MRPPHFRSKLHEFRLPSVKVAPSRSQRSHRRPLILLRPPLGISPAGHPLCPSVIVHPRNVSTPTPLLETGACAPTSDTRIIPRPLSALGSLSYPIEVFLVRNSSWASKSLSMNRSVLWRRCFCRKDNVQDSQHQSKDRFTFDSNNLSLFFKSVFRRRRSFQT